MEQHKDLGHLAAPSGPVPSALTVDAPLHTPGPWTLFAYEDGWHVNQLCGAGFVGTIRKVPHRAAECEANARMIAAAPELLQALQDILDTGFAGGPQGKRARAAIAKATRGAA